MGLIDRLFGGKNDYPRLPEGNAAQAALNQVNAQIEELASRTSDHLEVVPAEHQAFVFLGKPPKRFGIAWIARSSSRSAPDQASLRRYRGTSLRARPA